MNMHNHQRGNISIILILLAAVGLGIVAFTQQKRVATKPPEQPKELIRVFTPKPNADVYSPIEVTGEARGEWFFEASFPISLLGSDGNGIAHTVATAQGDWMTDDFVPFTATLTFPTPKASGTLTLVLEKDNPSGLPENAASVQVPLQFNDNYNWVKVYFQNKMKNPNINPCDKLFPVDRHVPRGEKAIARAALGHLIGGPDSAEESFGYMTGINPGSTVESLTIDKNGVATVKFGGNFDDDMGGACKVTMIRAQIEQTLKQFPTIKKVVIVNTLEP